MGEGEELWDLQFISFYGMYESETEMEGGRRERERERGGELGEGTHADCHPLSFWRLLAHTFHSQIMMVISPVPPMAPEELPIKQKIYTARPAAFELQ